MRFRSPGSLMIRPSTGIVLMRCGIMAAFPVSHAAPVSVRRRAARASCGPGMGVPAAPASICHGSRVREGRQEHAGGLRVAPLRVGTSEHLQYFWYVVAPGGLEDKTRQRERIHGDMVTFGVTQICHIYVSLSSRSPLVVWSVVVRRHKYE